MERHCAICDPRGTIQTEWLVNGERGGWATVEGGYIRLEGVPGNVIEVPIWHCPYCGRKLYEED